MKRMVMNKSLSKLALLATVSVLAICHRAEAASIGADIATMPFSVLEALIKHPLTDVGLQKFLKDWEKLPQQMRTGS